ncbi:hypothetical protein FJNA_21290 [Thermus sp. FJN-A]
MEPGVVTLWVQGAGERVPFLGGLWEAVEDKVMVALNPDHLAFDVEAHGSGLEAREALVLARAPLAEPRRWPHG